MTNAPRLARHAARDRETISPRAALGFLGLATDRVGLIDFQAYLRPFDGIAVHSNRVPFPPVVSPDTLATLAAGIKGSVADLVPAQPLDTISFSCTSGTVAVGEEAVAAAIHCARPAAKVVTPIGAALAAFEHLNVSRISIVLPYRMDVSSMMLDFFETADLRIDAAATFDLPGDPEMNRLDPERIVEVALDTFDPDSDALFVSCTGLNSFPIVDRLENRLGKPVLTSTQVLAWQALRGAGVTEQTGGQGAIFRQA